MFTLIHSLVFGRCLAGNRCKVVSLQFHKQRIVMQRRNIRDVYLSKNRSVSRCYKKLTGVICGKQSEFFVRIDDIPPNRSERSPRLTPTRLTENLTNFLVSEHASLDRLDQNRDRPVLAVPPTIGLEDGLCCCNRLKPLPLIMTQGSDGSKNSICLCGYASGSSFWSPIGEMV